MCGVAWWCNGTATRSNTDLDTSSRHTYSTNPVVGSHTDTAEIHTAQARTESETERPAPLDADGNDKPDKPSYQPAGYASRQRSPRTEEVRSTFALVLLDHIRPQPASQKKQYLRICSYLGRLPLSTRPEKRLDKTVGRAWPSSEYPKLSPNKSRSGPPQGCHRR